MITLNDKQLIEYEKKLKKFRFKAYPFATKNTLNNLAFKARDISRETISSKMTLKNKYTIRSVRVQKTNTLNLRQQESIVGSTANYMEVQEFGGTKKKKGEEGIAIATSYASGQEGQKKTKLPKRANLLQNIRLTRNNKGKNRKQKNFIAVQEAANSNKKYVFMDLGKTKGIFKVVGGKKKPKVKMVYSLKEQSVNIPKNPWLKPSTQKALKHGADIYTKSLFFQLKRHKLIN